MCNGYQGEDEMNQEDINRMAVEAWGRGHEIFYCNDDGIEKFAKLVAEECAKVCEEWGVYEAMECAAMIRERMK